MKSKKAVIELQFNWIFILIAGAVILFFFVRIVTEQKKASDNQISSEILVDLETILTGAKVSTGTVNIVSMPNTEVRFDCDAYHVGNLKIDIKDKVVFSTDVIKGRKLITWALDWSVPFTVTNFLYLTHPEVRYIIVGGSTFADDIYSLLPSDQEIDKEQKTSTNIGSVVDENNYRVKFVFVGNSYDPNNYNSVLSKFSRLSNSEVKAIWVKGSNLNSGEIYFYEKGATSWELESSQPTHYLKKESLIGAIFSHDLVNYNCAMDKAFERLKIIASIYQGRADELDGCSGIYGDASGHFGDIASAATSENIGNIQSAESSLKDLNRQAQLKSCVLLY